MPTIICDSREQRWEHVKEYLDMQLIPWIRSKLPCGDYGRLDNLTTVVDRKQSLNEVESNLIHDHERFRRECQLAQENGIKLIVLVEQAEIKCLQGVAKWKNPRLLRWQKITDAHARGKMLHVKISTKPPVDGSRLALTMRTVQERYGVEWRFCQKKNVGEEICRILGVTGAESSGSA